MRLQRLMVIGTNDQRRFTFITEKKESSTTMNVTEGDKNKNA
jgi:hypothetical protein